MTPFYQSSNITLLNGDAIELANTDQTPISCCLSDPPHFQLMTYHVDGQFGLEATVRSYTDRMVQVFRPIRQRMVEGGVFWLIVGDTSNVPSAIRGEGERREAKVTLRRKMQSDYLEKESLQVPWMLMQALRADGWHFRKDFIWDKGTSGQQKRSDTAPVTHAYVFQMFKWSKRGRPYLNCKPLDRTVLSYPPKSVKGHPCPLPHGLVRELLTASTKPGDVIIDPFAGSGQTLLTAADMGRSAIGYELKTEYCQLIADRDLNNPKNQQTSIFTELANVESTSLAS